ncbi:MAG: hypothetical protein HC869_26785, partial [Rhodospirillales bacterium]|nr:hypothetical protein [Rhodospirillales bacterium]
MTSHHFDGFVLLPPAACGDVAKAVRGGAEAVGLIDGLFETAPAVWHKELLWALSKGATLLGSSSMGALRAAEMWPFGMKGVGVVYRLYRSGAIIDDDEVALLHGPPEAGCVPLSEAMVNIRATLRRARRLQMITSEAERTIGRTAKSLHYKHRTLDRILQLSSNQLALQDTHELHRQLDGIRRDVKREDAILLLSRLRNVPANRTTADPIDFP